MKRILYFTGHRMTAFHWVGKKLSGHCSFEPDNEGYKKFEQYLASSIKAPVKLLVDVIEEDFRIESAPHVYGKDRKAVIGRMLDRFYRASKDFTYFEVLDRQKTGRRDDNVLLGAMTNPQLVEPWLNIIEENEVPLSGIWSLPLVSRKLLPVIGAKKGCVLLVSQQVNSNLRQSFFRDGKMLSSRQSVVNQDAADISQIGKFARPEIDKTIDFLRNQRYIATDEIIQVHILSADEQLVSLESSFRSDETRQIRIHRINELHKKLDIIDVDSKFSDGIFVWLCQKQFQLMGHYCKCENYSRYYYTLTSKALYAASLAVLVFALLITESNILSAMENLKAINLLKQQEVEYKRAYGEKFEAHEQVFMNARVMNSAVDLAQRITINSKVSPLDLYIEISNVISQSQLGKIIIDSIEWKSEQVKDNGNEKTIIEKPDITSKDTYRHTAILEGRISVPDDNYRVSVGKVNTIIAALMKNKRIEEVNAIEMPVEIRPEKRFSAESGADAELKTKKDKRGAFSLQIKMRSPNRV